MLVVSLVCRLFENAIDSAPPNGLSALALVMIPRYDPCVFLPYRRWTIPVDAGSLHRVCPTWGAY